MDRSLQSREIPRKRPWLAVILTAVVPGLGHAYLRLWGRALLWISLTVLGVLFLFPLDLMQDVASVEQFVEATGSLPPAATMAIVSIVGFCGLDAYLMAERINHFADVGSGEKRQHCPECGKELDGDLEFCHWCTTELDNSEA